MACSKKKIASMIDHTLLKPNATKEQIRQLCDEAKQYGFASVAINSSWVKFCSKELHKSGVKITACIGFPLGAMSTKAKVFEARQAVHDGADEIDMVMNIGRFLDGNREYVVKDIRKVVKAAGKHPVKVIIECCLLSPEQIDEACSIVISAGAAYAKTSTGFSTGGAAIEDVERMVSACKGAGVKVKAAGGIHNYEEAVAFVEAGADRIGTSSGVAICS